MWANVRALLARLAAATRASVADRSWATLGDQLLDHYASVGPAPRAGGRPEPNRPAEPGIPSPTPGVGRVMPLTDQQINGLDGRPLDLSQFGGRATLVVNVASKCGLTPQYAGLEELHERYKDRGFSVLGVPCNQFAGQEPGSSEEIAQFCSATYGVTFPMTEKVDVNGPDRHPLYAELTATPDAEGEAGDVKWNFEKFLIAPDGTVTRFRPMVAPEAEELVQAIEAALPD